MSLDANWIVEGESLRLGEYVYVRADKYDRLQRKLADLDRRHRNLQANFLMHQLKLGRKLAKKERRLIVNFTKGNYAEPAVRWFPEANVSPTSSARTETDSYVE